MRPSSGMVICKGRRPRRMASILGVTAGDLARLSDSEAVGFFADLLWADAHALGIDPEIDVPRVTDAPDGGIDATVKASVDMDAAGPGTIRPGTTRYQIKTEKGLNPATRSGIRRLLFKAGSGAELKPRIRKCLDMRERLVIVLFGTDTPAAGRDSDAENLIRQELAGVDPSYGDASVEVWRQNRLIGYIGRHPALQKRLTGMSQFNFVDHAHWSPFTGGMDTEFVAGRSQRNIVERARSALRRPGPSPDVRIVGTPGCGKTRAAYEIANVPYLAPLAMYFERPSHLRAGGLLGQLIEGRAARAILIVDECDTESWLYLRSRIEGTGGRIKLVTMHTKKDDEGCYELEDLGLPEIREIVARYKAPVSDDIVDELARACAPSPRYAHYFAKMLASDPAGPAARGLDAAGAIHERYLRAGLEEGDAGGAKKRKSVLLWFSLFARVGHEEPRSDESDFLRKKCGELDGISPREFDTIVDELRALKILQGARELYIAPWALHLWLWGEWWRVHGRGSNLGIFMRPGGGQAGGAEMPGALRASFREMLRNDSASGAVSGAARALLDRRGPFGDGAALDEREGAETFRAAAASAPDQALRLLRATLCGWDDGRLGRFGDGRRDVVWAVARAARRTEDIESVAEVLLCLAANENEQGLANSATGVFTSLFFMPPDGLSTTQASAKDRLALLSRLLRDADGRRRALALAACDSALESVHTWRAEYEHNPSLWKTAWWRPGGTELDSYRRVVLMLRGVIDTGGGEDGRRAAAVLLKRAGEMSQFEHVAGAVVGALRLALNRGAADRPSVAKAAELMLRAGDGSMGREAAAACRRLAARLAGGDDYRLRMRQHVAAASPAEAARPQPGGPSAAEAEKNLAELADESLRNRAGLLGQSDWLFGPGVGRAQQFGAALAERDGGFSLLLDLIGAMAGSGPEPSEALIGGYLGVVLRRDGAAWDAAMDALEISDRLAPLVPKIAWLSGITDRSWARLALMHGRGAIRSDDIGILAYGGRACALSDGAFGEALGILLDDPPAGGPAVPLALLSARCGCGGGGGGRDIPAGEARRVLLDAAFLAEPRNGGGGIDGPDILNWATVAGAVIRCDPGQIPRMAGPLLGAMGAGRGVFSGPRGGMALGALDLMASREPELMWSLVAGMASAPPDPATYKLLDWAGGHDMRSRTGKEPTAFASPADMPVPLLESVAPESVWKWVDADRGPRAECLAMFVPRTVEPGGGSITRGLLSRYGGDKRVRDALHRGFSGAMRLGATAGQVAAARMRCEDLAGGEGDPAVRTWLDERIQMLGGLSADMAAAEERASLA